jgi:hypothetical protein
MPRTSETSATRQVAANAAGTVVAVERMEVVNTLKRRA